MQDFNKITITGRLTRDPELRHTPSGVPVCNFGFACNRSYRDAEGKEYEDTLFIDMAAWKHVAETCQDHLKKGSHVLIHGNLQIEKYDCKVTREKREKVKIHVREVIFLSKKESTPQ